MKHGFFNVKHMEEVEDILTRQAEEYPLKKELIPIQEGLGRIISRDINASSDLPKFNRSTVDGFAVVCQDAYGATESIPCFLNYLGEVFMGEETDFKIHSGETVYVPTGGMVPEGTEAMVMIEYSEKLDLDTILIHKPVGIGENISYIGDDIKLNEVINKKGTKITSYDIGLFAGMGITAVEVFAKPRITIISTGDEIVEINQETTIGQVRDINGYALQALVTELGATVVSKLLIRDDFELLKEGMDSGLLNSDIIIISGGSSVGMRDYTKDLVESYDSSEVLVHGISVKPGKPTIVGAIKGKMVFGLPGHPVSALTVCKQVVGSYIKQLMFMSQNEVYIHATLANSVHGAPGRDTFQMVSLVEENEKWIAVPIHGKSGMMSLLTKASGYFKISMDKEGCNQNDIVKVYLLQEVFI